MDWNNQFPKTTAPTPAQISAYISSENWQSLCDYLEQTYQISPHIEYSTCSGAPGWNVKYKKSGRSLCTLYPNEGFFTALVTIGSKEAMEAELLLGDCTAYLRDLYWQVKPLNGARWLMIAVHDAAVLEDIKRLIATRVKPKK